MIWPRILLVFITLNFTQCYAQSNGQYLINVNVTSPSNEPIHAFFNGLTPYHSREYIMTDMDKDCSILVRQPGSKSAFFHIKKAEVNSGKSDNFSIKEKEIQIDCHLSPLIKIDEKNYANKSIPKFVKLEFDPSLKHTFRYSMKMMLTQLQIGEGLIDLSGLDQTLIRDNIYKVFRDEMGTVEQQKSLFSENQKEEGLSDDLLLAGRVKYLTNLHKGPIRTMNIAIEWNVYSKSRDSVIFKDMADIEFIMDEFYKGIGAYDAICLSIQKLLDHNENFHDALKIKKDTTQIVAGEPLAIRLIKAGAKFALADIAKKSVVTIIRPDGGHGSGFLISEDGFLLTNAHVVETYNELEVVFESGLKLKGRVVRKSDQRDVALLKLDASGFMAVCIAKTQPALGSNVTVVGTPASLSLGQSVSKGVLSGYRDEKGLRYIQTDASINPGNSGGPLLNESLEVVGIVVSKIAHEKIEGISFAIPIQDALDALNIVAEL